jgi:hypothetical protein
LSRTVNLIARDEDQANVDIFHQLYMPSTKAIRLAVERIRRLDPCPLMIAPQHGGIVGPDRIETVLERFERLEVGVDLLTNHEDRERYIRLANDVLRDLSPLLGPDCVQGQLRRFAADGTFPNLFVLSTTGVIVDIKIEPRAAIRSLLHDLRACSQPSLRPSIRRIVDEAARRHGVSLSAAPEELFDLRHVVIEVDD